MSQVREIAQLGAEVLRLQAKEVKNMHADEMQLIADDMFTTLADTNGVGIAAPQISASWRMMILASRPSERYPQAPEMDPTLMINPSFEPLSETQEKDWEGCLSIPGIRAKVPRYTQIKVSYTDTLGKLVEQTLDGFVARVFQHEYDHLDGLVYLDRVENNRDIISEQEFAKE
ncbi:peptide deformylase [Bathymodiolus platifrons methanotrophic gill symbiont]|uniref:peptide deformylase n=1 Tax=Bathymodiolus platifrons methanotrophic gill symbiont TaxID=113268 RepID=UPI000B410D79|nr:peptide deformylase [Bathymodiolus platifrons methanotrophic gill symbiont]MCK5869977.1 peptide deformylase [Methyloprofundus sp.]TXK95454.1 peptide deformylase [Methylococcaceae bacterium CS4]TXK99831.1 peptide deformylase [Methylococcaceae bacterium CS5]TXL06457.1 peptide deformylase [Methylococcaceae bacterium CS1]TXL07217.1 peptide deformylase [Methylococcaceae bacterium CS3]TXL10876.1 peptide deformylase [Methylococcaceae bacterium CS2]